jgi:hypothetical protein
MWWKVKEGIKSDADFSKFRKKVLSAPVKIEEKNGIADVAVNTQAGWLGVKTDVANKKRLNYYNPKPLPANFLFNIDGVEIGKPLMEKYILNILK